MKLNLACGDDRRDGYLNVDFREDVADLVTDVSDLKGIEDSSADEILALDILEHFPVFYIQDVLAEWRRVLKPSGVLVLRVPNLHALSTMLIGSSLPADALIRNIYGGHRWGPDGAWDAHHWGWTPDTLERDLRTAGFEVIKNDHDPNMTVECQRIH